MIYHYCRVSTKEQNLDRQIDALAAYKPADRVFCDKQSGKNFEREQYQLMKSIAQRGDEIIVKELDRLGRNKEGIKAEIEWARQNGVTLRILDLPTSLIDFQGQDWIADMVNNILIEVLGSLAEQERQKIKNRQAEGIAAKKARGDWDDYGRPALDVPAFAEYHARVERGELTVTEACKALNVSRSWWYTKSRTVA